MRRPDGRDGQRHLHVAAVTLRHSEDPTVNRRRLIEMTRSILQDHPETRLVAFAELALGWYWHVDKKGLPFPESVRQSTEYHRRIAEPVPGPTTKAMGEVARELGVFISYGFTEAESYRIFNSQALISPDGHVIDVRRKSRLITPMFSPGANAVRCVDVDGARVLTIICADTRRLSTLLAIRRLRPDLIIHSILDREEKTTHEQLLAPFLRSWMVVPNRFGWEHPTGKRRPYSGMTCICSPHGRVAVGHVGSEYVLTYAIPIRRRPRAVYRPFLWLFSLLSFAARLLASVPAWLVQFVEHMRLDRGQRRARL